MLVVRGRKKIQVEIQKEVKKEEEKEDIKIPIYSFDTESYLLHINNLYELKSLVLVCLEPFIVIRHLNVEDLDVYDENESYVYMLKEEAFKKVRGLVLEAEMRKKFFLSNTLYFENVLTNTKISTVDIKDVIPSIGYGYTLYFNDDSYLYLPQENIKTNYKEIEAFRSKYLRDYDVLSNYISWEEKQK
jgi:hypothetical protein